MADPFLHSHRIGALHVFVLANRVLPLSIRDQMIRGEMLAERLSRSYESRASPILVVGAGACGATAAIGLAERGHRVDLIELRDAPFLLQTGCATRWLDPTQYDWPTDHWPTGTCPWTGRALPLAWTADRAQAIGLRWVLSLATAEARLRPRLRIEWNTTYRLPLLHTTHRVFVHVATPSGTALRPYQAVIFALGFGSEICTPRAGSFPGGLRFWEDDPFESPRCGLDPGLAETVLISGSGDGALQDFLRIVTRRKSARDVLDALPLSDSIVPLVQSAEERNRAAWAWGQNRAGDHPWHAELEQKHRDAVAEALGDPDVVRALGSVTDERPERVVLSHPCRHLTPIYALNRFLTMLLLTYFEEHGGTRPVMRYAECELDRVDCQHPGRATCLGGNHRATFVHPVGCLAGGPTAPRGPEQFTVVVVRHGLNRPAHALSSEVVRHVLPPHLL